MGEKVCTYSFLGELFDRAASVSLGSDCKNQCVCIDMSGCSRDFIIKSERFLKAHPDMFRVIARGIDVYLEINNGESFLHACEKAYENEQSIN